MRRASGRHICEPAAIPGEVVAERRARRATPRSTDGDASVHRLDQLEAAAARPQLFRRGR